MKRYLVRNTLESNGVKYIQCEIHCLEAQG
nr:MAG TPA: hypothetical protein [Caudoviricetes sp.]